MDTEILKKALPRGIVVGLIVALVVILARTLIGGNGFMQNLGSVYGILTLICFPIAFVCYFYYDLKKKEK